MTQALLAIRNRDEGALMQAFQSLEEAERFRAESLPSLSPDDCLWFWQQIMTPGQLERTVNAVRDVCLGIAKELELVANVHYSLGHNGKTPTLVCSAMVAKVFYARLPRERHSILRFYLQITS